ncbi:hypothetical protein HPB48_010134 [Haemaphysalis longicornis]|uniref:F-box domain-containing protein n=1 Tax=Haemaphysalis longicornis TaxID=44386 RepID=A0A9J6FPZ8_HAELO|nr:hypothetical protein HPB48_010134 [Haemaphysalis longicornis]
MAVALYNYDYARLPDNVWLRILSYADTDTLLAMEATASCFTNIVRDEHLSANVRCSPSSDEMTLHRFFTTRAMHKVKVLDVSNCIVAAPDVILSWVGACNALTDLRCVNCPLPFTGLLIVLMEQLPHLHRMDWSFFGENFSDNTGRVMAWYNERAIPQLRSTYVDVACQGAENHALLSFLLKRCILLQKLHLHAFHGDFTAATAMCFCAATFAISSGPTLIYSTELDAVQGQQRFFTSFKRLMEVPSNCSAGTIVCGNRVFLKESTPGPSSFHTHAMSECVETPRFKQVVVVLRNEPGVVSRLSKVAIEMTWAHIEALTLALLPYAATDTINCTCPRLRHHLKTFLNSFRGLTELNLNSFHFGWGVDCCKILAAAAMRLRALSLAPCGINRRNCFINLAMVSSKLEELDVRMNSDNVSSQCIFCSEPFRVREDDAAILQQGSELRRLTLCGVMKVNSLDFIASLRPSEIRLSFMPWHSIGQPRSIGHLLRCNDNLHSLVLRDHSLSRGLEFYQQNLDVLSRLNHLSLDVRAPSEIDKVRLFFNHMTARLPMLETLHLHYVSGDNIVRNTDLVAATRTGIGKHIKKVEIREPCWWAGHALAVRWQLLLDWPSPAITEGTACRYF